MFTNCDPGVVLTTALQVGNDVNLVGLAIEHVDVPDPIEIVPVDINSYTIKALALSQLWIENNYHLSQPIKYTVFAMMPFRHMHTIKYNMYVLELLDTMKCFSDDMIYIKFKNTTSRFASLD